MTFNSAEQQGFGRRSLRFALLCSILVHALLLSQGFRQPTASPDAALHTATNNAQLKATLLSPSGVQSPAMQPVSPALLDHPGDKKAAKKTLPSAPDTASRLAALKQSASRVTKAVAPAALSGFIGEPANKDLVQPAKPSAEALDKPSIQAGVPGVPSNSQAETMKPAAGSGEVAAGVPAAEQKTAPAAEGVSADGLRRYRLNLAVQARSFKRYPAQARAAGWVGRVELFLSVNSTGQAQVSVNKSSGYGVLDEAGRAMIEASAQRTPIPDSLRGKAFSLVVPVVFDLNDG